MQVETELTNRRLRLDGVSIVEPEGVAALLLRGVQPSQLRLTHLDADTTAFNARVADEEALKLNEPEPINVDLAWRLPEKYLTLDLDDYIINLAAPIIENAGYGEAQFMVAIHRVTAELEEIKRRGMVEFMKTIIYVLDVFRERGVVWGVGRGSSCASYVLFILGLHAVDCVKYNVPMAEFYHD